MAATITRRYDALTRRAAAAGAAVVLWPESATPYYFNEEPQRAEEVRRLVRDIGTPLLFGTDEIERGTAAALLQLGVHARSRRRRGRRLPQDQLVPFGEYVPLRSLLFFVTPLVEGVGGFSAGDRVTMLPMAGHMASTAICYEIVYPHLAREAVRQGAELLTTITNDALVRRLLGAVPALRAGVAAGHRAGPLSGPRRQHRHQRRGRSVRPGDRRHRRLRGSGGASPRCAS